MRGGGGQRLFGIFPKKHPFWYSDPSLTTISIFHVIFSLPPQLNFTCPNLKQWDQAQGRSWVNCLTKCKILCQRIRFTLQKVHLPTWNEAPDWLVFAAKGKRTDGILGEPPA